MAEQNRLIANISPLIHLFADERNYILIIRKSEEQLLRNADHSYLRNLDDVFIEIYSYLLKENLADDRDKSIEEIANIVIQTKKEVMAMMKPFEDLSIGIQHDSAQPSIKGV